MPSMSRPQPEHYGFDADDPFSTAFERARCSDAVIGEDGGEYDEPRGIDGRTIHGPWRRPYDRPYLSASLAESMERVLAFDADRAQSSALSNSPLIPENRSLKR